MLLLRLILGALPAALCFRLELPSDQAAIPTDSFTVSWHLEEDDDPNGELGILLAYMAYDGKTINALSAQTTFRPTGSSTVLPPSFLPAVRPSETMAVGLGMHLVKDGEWMDRNGRAIYLVGQTQEPNTATATASGTMAAGETSTAGTNVASETPAPNNTAEEVNEGHEDKGGHGGLSTGAKAGIGAGSGAAVVLIIVAAWFYLSRFRSGVTPPGREEDGSDTPELETRERRVFELGSTNKSIGLSVQVKPAAESGPRERYELGG